MKIIAGVALAAAAALGAAAPQDHKPAGKPEAAPAAEKGAADEAALIRAQKPSYPLTTCPVSGEKLGEKAIDVVVDGRLVRLCCPNCKAGLQKDQAAMLAKVDAAVVAAQKPGYPLATCPISGEKLSDKSIDVVRGTKLVRLCCKNCVADLDKDPAAALAKVDKAWIDAQLKSYPLDTCPVSGEKLGKMGEPVNVLYGTTLVRLCCNSCKKQLDKDGAAIVAKIAEARAKPQPK